MWKKKLMRKGKERRAIFAKSMHEMAESSRQRQSQSQASLDTSHSSNRVDSAVPHNQQNRMPPPSRPVPDQKRRSLPSGIQNDTMPNADSNKRKREQPPVRTKDAKPSLSASFQPHHKRSRTMDDSRRLASSYGRFADFSQLDENSYANDKVLQQAKRLAGHAKLDSTRGDYFALKARGIDPDTAFAPQSGAKRSRVDNQSERVRKLLKPSPPDAKEPISQLTQHFSNGISPSNDQSTVSATMSNNGVPKAPPNDLLAQLRVVREAMAESTAWMQSEREKSERLSSSQSSETAHHPAPTQASSRTSNYLSEGRQGRQWKPTPTRAQRRLERTKANGLLPPNWDWNRSVTEWKRRGGTGSPRPGASREQSTGSSSAVTPQQGKRPIGFVAATQGFGQRRQPMKEERDMVYNDEEGASDDEEGSEGEDDEYGDGAGDNYTNGYGEEDSGEDEVGGKEQDGDTTPERARLDTQGNSADTAIDLDD